MQQKHAWAHHQFQIIQIIATVSLVLYWYNIVITVDVKLDESDY